jgi:hypothetical protein
MNFLLPAGVTSALLTPAVGSIRHPWLDGGSEDAPFEVWTGERWEALTREVAERLKALKAGNTSPL